MLLLIVGTDTYAYIGATVDPKSRLRAHASSPTQGVKWALDKFGKTSDDLLYVPLQTASEALSHAAEVNWTVLIESIGVRKLNCFGTYGKPAKSRHFWQRKHYQKCRDQTM